METAPIYVLSAATADPAKPEFPGITVIAPHLIAISGRNRVVRERLLTLLTSAYEDTGSRIHAETILLAAGALAGVAARSDTEYRGVEELLRISGAHDLVAQPNGEKALKEIAIWALIKKVDPGSLSVWRIIAGGIIHDGATEIPDMNTLWKVTFERRDKEGWGSAVIDRAHATHENAFSCVSRLWPQAHLILDMAVRRGSAAFEAASAAQILLTRSKKVLPLNVGASLVMQGTVMTALDKNLARQIALSISAAKSCNSRGS